MTVLQSIWIHGTAAQTQDLLNPGLSKAFRHPYGIEFLATTESSNWFNFAVPSPVIISDRRMKIDGVMLAFQSTQAFVSNVEVYDAADRIAHHDNLTLSVANNPFQRFAINDDPNHSVVSGISIRVGVTFQPILDATPPSFGTVLFFAAGADFT